MGRWSTHWPQPPAQLSLAEGALCDAPPHAGTADALALTITEHQLGAVNAIAFSWTLNGFRVHNS